LHVGATVRVSRVRISRVRIRLRGRVEGLRLVLGLELEIR